MNRFWPTGLLRYLASHPRAVPAVIRSAWRLRRNDWYRRRPFLPVPDDAYWDFRRATARGSHGASFSARDVVDAATWAAHQRVVR